MPLYEYYCGDCNGVFELLRPIREMDKTQSCPECDTDSERIMSKTWAAFIFRDGYPRRIPDDGTYYHLGKKVTQPITGSSDGYSHPELKARKPDPEPTVADVEEFEAISEIKLAREREFGGNVTAGELGKTQMRKAAALRRPSTNRVQAEKQRVMRKIVSQERQARQETMQELEGRIREAEKRNKAEFPPAE